jgi:hypothetical protein
VHDRPEGRGHQARLAAAVADFIARAPQLRRFDHFRVEARQAVVGRRGVILEEVHHLGNNGIAKFQAQGLDDGLASRAVSAAGIGEEEEDVWFGGQVVG